MARAKSSKKHEGLKHKDKPTKEKVPEQLEQDGDAELLKGSKGEGQLTTGTQLVDVRGPKLSPIILF